jgi:DNA-binding response OmpR family regulator
MKYHKTHILIIEDEPDINELLSITLLKKDYAVTKVFDGEKGLKIAREISPDLILLDLMLPGISGLDVCKLLKSEQETSFIKIIILTALSQEHNIVKGLELGADDYITKPFSIKVLNARIKSVLRRNSTEKE